jgi:hypothetical protein
VIEHRDRHREELGSSHVDECSSHWSGDEAIDAVKDERYAVAVDAMRTT